MKKTALMLLLLCSDARGEIPSFQTAKHVVEECYDGWDVVVKVSAGADTKYSWENSLESSVANSEGSGEISTDSITTKEFDSDQEFGEEGGDGQYFETTASRSAQEELSRNINTSTNDYQSDGWSRSIFAGVTITVPLYSRDTRISKQEKRAKAVSDIADLYAKFDGYEATVQALEKEIEIVRRVMMDTGYQGISNYYGMLTEIEKSRALKISAGRKIMSKLEVCGYVEKNRTDRKRQSAEESNHAKAAK